MFKIYSSNYRKIVQLFWTIIAFNTNLVIQILINSIVNFFYVKTA